LLWQFNKLAGIGVSNLFATSEMQSFMWHQSHYGPNLIYYSTDNCVIRGQISLVAFASVLSLLSSAHPLQETGFHLLTAAVIIHSLLAEHDRSDSNSA